MKIKHGQMEEFRRDPKSYGGRVQVFGGASMYRDWQLSVRKYHRTDIVTAQDYLDNAFGNHFKTNKRNEAKFARYQDLLAQYATDYQSLGHHVFEVQHRMNFEYRPEVFITGELARIDLVAAGGYATSVFHRTAGDWKSELRFPILQLYTAHLMGASSGDVRVGIFNVGLGKHEFAKCDGARLRSARREFNFLLKKAGA